MRVDARDAAIRALQGEIVEHLCDAYHGAATVPLYPRDCIEGHKAGVRDVAVRLGLYSEFVAALDAE